MSILFEARLSSFVLLAVASATAVRPAPGELELEQDNLEQGFQSLFDGESLSGWVTRGGRYDGNAAWSVEEGAIVGRLGPESAGGLLYTERPYTAFVLRFETKIDYPFDSGVFLRMAPEGKGAQITLDYRPDGEIGAVYSDGFLQHNEEGVDAFRRDAWNQVEVRCTGFDMKIQCWINGTLVTDYELPANSKGYAPTGLIGLQVHGGRDDPGAARFRNLRIRKLPIFEGSHFEANSPLEGQDSAGLERISDAGRAAGWKALFNGRDLDGWEIAGETDRFRVDAGVLTFLARGGGGHLFTSDDYRDFRLRLDFQLSRMTNSGLFLRAARDGSNPAYSGCEVQILDDFNWETVTGSTLKPWQLTGSLYGAVAAGEHGMLNGIGEWNTYEVLYVGTRLAVALNGRTLYDVDTATVGGKPPFVQRAPTGFIGLQHHGSAHLEDEALVRFRNVFVQSL